MNSRKVIKTNIPLDPRKPKVKILLQSDDQKLVSLLVEEIKEDVQKRGTKMKGPISIPTRRYKVNSRKSPGSFGSETYRNYYFKKIKKFIYLYNQEDILPLFDRILKNEKFNNVNVEIISI
jgi:small subunit ribosomal protein S10